MTLTEKTAERQTDGELVAAVRHSETRADDAFGELVRRNQRMVYALALSLVRDADADDVVQEAFLRAFRNLDLLADPAKFGVWLRRITFGVAIDHARATRSRDALIAALPVGADDESRDIPEIADPGPSPLERLERLEVTSNVLAALDRMPARYRVPLTLYHLDGLTHAKVAGTLGIPEGTVRSLVARARKKLAHLLASAPEARAMTDDIRSLRQSADVLDETGSPPPRFLHVLNGDSVRGTLEHSDVPGAFAVYADVLHEGPVPPESGTAAARDTRARYLSARGFVPYADAVRTGEAWDAKLDTFADYDEVVLWFEHDLFDQLLLIRHLDWFSRRNLGRTRLSLICIGEFPGYERFDGLGQLNPDELTSLLGTRQLVSPEQTALGRRAWRAFTAPNPGDLDALASEDHRTLLPFLSGALRRLLEEYPSVTSGLPRTEREILELLAERPMSPVELFVAMQRREERVFMGDSTFWDRVRGLTEGGAPLLSFSAEPGAPDDRVLPAGMVAITEQGRTVLAGGADSVRLRGLDKWIGGVHLSAPSGGDVAWRYDPAESRLVRSAWNQ